MAKKLIFILITFLCLPGVVLASEGTPLAEAEDLPGLLTLVLNWIISLVGLIALGVLIVGGFNYLTSGGSPMAMAKARQRIFQGLLGIIIILASYLIVWQINPNILDQIFRPLPGVDITWPDRPTPPEPDKTVYEYQEMPFGSILETRILAKNISCFEGNRLIDCHSQDSVAETETNILRRMLAANFPEIWPDPSREDALIAYLCYDFDEEGDFLDGNPDLPGIQPIPFNDRLDCLERVTRALEVKSEELRDLTEELYQLSDNCYCGRCSPSCGACEDCSPCDTCRCAQNCSGEACPDRARMQEIQEELDMAGFLEGKNLLREDQLVQVSVDSFELMTLVNQIRYLASRFLPPHIESLRLDLGYLEKVEEMYKIQCDYGTHLTLAAFQQLSEDFERKPFHNLEANPFCLNDNAPAWGEKCSPEDQLNISPWCYDFNCLDCEEGGQRIDCGQCDLDELKKGIPVNFPWGDTERTSYKCSVYRINQQDGETGRETEDDLGIMCRVQDDGRHCSMMGGSPATFYCPPGSTDAPIRSRQQELMSEPLIDTYVRQGYQSGTIEIGQLTDNAQVYIEKLISELTVLVEISAPNVTCPSFDKDDPGNQCKLFHLPDRCQCNEGIMITTDGPGCGPGCMSRHGCLCNDCGSCPGCACTWCLVGGVRHPCPINIIEDQKDETQLWYEDHPDSVKKRAEQVWNLILAVDLQEHQPDRNEMINQLSDAQIKFAVHITGFGLDPGEVHTTDMALNCSHVLDLQGLEEEGLEFHPYVETCYPYNSQSPYEDNALTEQELEACRLNRLQKECRDAVSDLMPDYIWFTEEIDW